MHSMHILTISLFLRVITMYVDFGVEFIDQFELSVCNLMAKYFELLGSIVLLSDDLMQLANVSAEVGELLGVETTPWALM